MISRFTIITFLLMITWFVKKEFIEIFFKVIEDPINGWNLFERAFFKRIAFEDKTLLDSKEVFELVFPSYVFLNRKLKTVFITKVLINFTKGVFIKSTETKKVYGSYWVSLHRRRTPSCVYTLLFLAVQPSPHIYSEWLVFHGC